MALWQQVLGLPLGVQLLQSFKIQGVSPPDQGSPPDCAGAPPPDSRYRLMLPDTPPQPLTPAACGLKILH